MNFAGLKKVKDRADLVYGSGAGLSECSLRK